MPRLTDLELQIEDIPEHQAADAWKRLTYAPIEEDAE